MHLHELDIKNVNVEFLIRTKLIHVPVGSLFSCLILPQQSRNQCKINWDTTRIDFPNLFTENIVNVRVRSSIQEMARTQLTSPRQFFVRRKRNRAIWGIMSSLTHNTTLYKWNFVQNEISHVCKFTNNYIAYLPSTVHFRPQQTSWTWVRRTSNQ